MRSEATATKSQKLGSHEWTLNYRVAGGVGVGEQINRQMEEESCGGEIGLRKMNLLEAQLMVQANAL